MRLAVLAAGLIPVATPADTVTLDNGDRLSGTIVGMEASSLTLETAYAGTLKLPWRQVSQIESDAPVRVRLADGTEVDGRLRNGGDGRVRIGIGRLAETAPLTLDRIAALNPPRDADKTTVKGRIAAGGSVTNGNTDAATLHLSADVVARNPAQRVTLGAELNEASQDGVDTASNWRLGLKYDHFLADKTYLYANTRFDHDGQTDLDLRSTLGVGAGRQIFDRKELKLSVEGGVSLVSEDYGSAPDTRFPGARVALNYEQGVWDDRATLFHDSELLLSLETLEDYLYRSRTGLRVPVSEKLSLGTQVNFDYDAVPAAGKQSSDTALIFKLDYAL